MFQSGIDVPGMDAVFSGKRLFAGDDGRQRYVLFHWLSVVSCADRHYHVDPVPGYLPGNLCGERGTENCPGGAAAKASVILFRKKGSVRSDQYHYGGLCRHGDRLLPFHSGTGRLLHFYDTDRHRYLFPELENGYRGIMGTARILPHCGLFRQGTEVPEQEADEVENGLCGRHSGMPGDRTRPAGQQCTGRVHGRLRE